MFRGNPISLSLVCWQPCHCSVSLSKNCEKVKIKNQLIFSNSLKSWKSKFQVPISLTRWQKAKKRMVVRSPKVAHSAASQPTKLLIWKDICVYTVERSLSVATSANTLAKLLLTSRDTFEGYIVMRGLSSAHSVGMLVHLQVIWGVTCKHIQGKNLSAAHSVSILVQQQVGWGATC